MIRLRFVIPAIIAVLLLAAPAPAQKPTVTSPTSPMGSEARLRVLDGKRTVTVKGELLAVDSSHVWLLVDNHTTTIPRAQVREVRARAHKYDGKRGMLMGLVGGIATGLGMAAACGSVEDATGCGSFVVAWEAIWLLVTAISALFMERNSWDTLPLNSWTVIAAYARYPQGVPPLLIAEPYVGKP